MVFLWFSHKTTIFPWFSYGFPSCSAACCTWWSAAPSCCRAPSGSAARWTPPPPEPGLWRFLDVWNRGELFHVEKSVEEAPWNIWKNMENYGKYGKLWKIWKNNKKTYGKLWKTIWKTMDTNRGFDCCILMLMMNIHERWLPSRLGNFSQSHKIDRVNRKTAGDGGVNSLQKPAHESPNTELYLEENFWSKNTCGKSSTLTIQ